MHQFVGTHPFYCSVSIVLYPEKSPCFGDYGFCASQNQSVDALVARNRAVLHVGVIALSGAICAGIADNCWHVLGGNANEIK